MEKPLFEGPKLRYPLINVPNFWLNIFLKSFYEKSNAFHTLLNTYFRALSTLLREGFKKKKKISGKFH